jgi:serine/threonine-protein kinase
MLSRTVAAPSVLSTLVLGAAGLIAAAEPAGQAKPAAPATEVLRLPAGWQLNRGQRGPMLTEIALAPDGASVVFSASPDGTMPKARVYRQVLNGSQAALIPNIPEGACMPTVSPDGQWILFWAAQKLHKIAVKGGASVPVADVGPRPVGLSWSPDGRTIYYGGWAKGLARVRADGGKPETLTTVNLASEETHRLPHALPDGKGLFFTAMLAATGLEARVEWLSLESGKRKLLVEDAADGRYAPTGHLVFVRRGALMIAPFDLARVEITGPAMIIVPGVIQAFNSTIPGLNSGAGQYSVSASGALIWASGGIHADPKQEHYWVDRSGREERWPGFGGKTVGGFRLSPDGQRVVFNTHGLERAVWVHDIRRNRTTKLTSIGQSSSILPFWTPDGKRVAFGWVTEGFLTVWWMAADGGGKAEQLMRGTSDVRGSSWTRDGKYLAFVDDPSPQADVKVLRMADRTVIPFAATKAREAFPEFSPDGRWLAYVSNETGRNEVYVRSFPDGLKTLQVSIEGGISPAWAPNRRELFYFSIGFKTLMKVDISGGRTLSAGAPRQLFEFGADTSGAVRTYDITPDGQRFLIQKRDSFTPVPVTELNLRRRLLDTPRRGSAPTP